MHRFVPYYISLIDLMFNKILVFHCNTYHPIPRAGLYIEQESQVLAQHNPNTPASVVVVLIVYKLE